jgi:hypothetical protein
VSKQTNILLLIGGAAIVYYLINKNNNNQTPGNTEVLNTPIDTINTLIQTAADPKTLPEPVPVNLKTRSGTMLTAIETGSSNNQPLFTTILQTRAGDLPITSSANFIEKNKTATLQNLAITQNILNTQTNEMLLPADPGLLPEQLLPPKKTGNLVEQLKKMYL